MSLRTDLQDKLNAEFSRKFTSNDVDQYMYLFKRKPELRDYPKRELMEVLLSDPDALDAFFESVKFCMDNKK
jgi:hypothetical protein